MAKQAILDVLEKTIGKYVKNLDAQSLNVAVWKGQIQLQSLELDLDAINTELARHAAESPNLAIPFRVIDGGFGSLQVDVPWSHIMSQPVVLRAKGLKVVVEPYDAATSSDYLVDAQISEQKRMQKIHQQRTQTIQSADDFRQQANALRKLADEESDYVSGSDAENNATFTENLVRRIIENIQLDVTDVHLSLKSSGTSAGVVLQSFSIFTTDKDGTRQFVDRQNEANNFLYKVLQISGLGLYLDELSAVSKPTPIPVQSDDVQHSYILAPLSFEAKLRQAGSKKCIDYPKYLVQSELHQMSMMLSKTQLELGSKIAAAIAPSENVSHPLFPEYRPLRRVTKDSAREWWRYALRCVDRLCGRGLWDDFFYAFKRRQQYIPLYKRFAHAQTCPWLTPLSGEEQSQLDSIEQDRMISVEGIMAWRNIADAQVELEQKKHAETEKKKAKATGGIMTALFGSKETAHSEDSAREDDPPITLSVEEMQELESISLQQAEDAELSKDSKLCDITFVLGSFKVSLEGYNSKQLASIEMGTASTTFRANADGSYVFSSDLASLDVCDKVTLKSLFPTVVQGIPSAAAADKDRGVFQFSLEKSKTGDQRINLYMAAFEVIASQMLVTSMKHFFSLSRTASAQSGAYENAMLRESLSGTVDLFYDAHEGGESAPTFDFAEGRAAATEKISETLSLALVDAWKSKTKEKTQWMVECDIHAPILVFPESCSSPDANVLIFDFGRFRFSYGRDHVASKVQKWFDEQPDAKREVSVIDPGSVGITDLTFTIGRAGDFQWRQPPDVSVIGEEMAKLTVIEPLSCSFHFGILSDVGKDVPTVCAEGVIPVLGLSISPSQITKVLSVYAGWKPVILELTGQSGRASEDAEHAIGGIKIVEEGGDDRDDDDDHSLHEEDLEASPIRKLSQARRSSIYQGSRASVYRSRASIYHSAKTGLSPKALLTDARTTLHVSIGLKRLSIRVLTYSGEGIEAHLVSVSASMSSRTNGSSVSCLRMGWFWVLDRFNYDFTRRQRLIAHSTLPRSPEFYSKDDKYDVLHSLPLGAFDASYNESSGELANIKLTSKGSTLDSTPDLNPFSGKDHLGSCAEQADSNLNAQFSSLYVHWNPQAIKVITQSFSTTIGTLKSLADKEITQSSASSNIQPADFLSQSFSHSVLSVQQQEVPERRTSLFISAELKTLEITLDSAKDDLPLFDLSMSDTKMRMLSSQFMNQNSKTLSLELGDVRVVTPDESRTNASYKTLLGLAPDHTDSLLAVDFSMGDEAIQASDMENVDPRTCSMCGEITLSPMRLVYIQAQVMTLVEYITQGVLGALTAQAASSAAEAAVEITQSSSGEQYFVVKATGFDIVVPESASISKSLSVKASDLSVDYRGGRNGGKVGLSLSDVSMIDSEKQPMVSAPMRMTIDVVLPPADVGTMDDRAMRITINFFQAEFLLTRSQYQGIMIMLAENIGQVDPMLRITADDSPKDPLYDGAAPGPEDTSGKTSDEATEDITHGGAAAVDTKNRMYINFNLDVLSLDLCGANVSDPIVHFAALEANIEMKMLPDEDAMTVDARLQELTCDDRRLEAMDRPFRSLMSRVQLGGADDDAPANDIFYASYKKVGDSSTEVDLKLGSPRIVFIPDVVSQILQFFKRPDVPDKAGHRPAPDEKVEKLAEGEVDGEQVVKVHVGDKGDSVETALMSLSDGGEPRSLTTMSFSIKTANCSFVLIDMGASENGPGLQKKSLTQVTESIVFQGQFSAQTSLSSEAQGGRLVAARGELHGDCMEMYTAHGSTFTNPIQISEPASISAFVSLQPCDNQTKSLDVRFVTLSPVDVTFSTQNAALLNAIVSSCSDWFGGDQSDKANVGAVVPLSEQDASNIEALSSALQAPYEIRRDEDSSVQNSSAAEESVVSSMSERQEATSLVTRVQVTMTETKFTLINDLQGMDEALFRINASNFAASAEINQSQDASSGSANETTFKVQVNTSFMADYFDSSVQLWKVLLKRPWEITCKSSRAADHRSPSHRMSSVVDIEAYPCLLSFSEQFVVSLSAASKMWSIYSIATSKAAEDRTFFEPNAQQDLRASRKALAACAARSLVASLPYAVENHSGVDVYLLVSGSGERRVCRSGTIQYFRFEPPQGTGSGGQRRYGQDVTTSKAVSIFVEGKTIEIGDIDAEFGRPRQAHLLGKGRYLVSHASKDGKTKTLHLSSPVDIHNCTSVSFSMAVIIDGKDHDFGNCLGHLGDPSKALAMSAVTVNEKDGSTSKASKCFGVPLSLLSEEDRTTTLHLSPLVEGGRVSGEVILPSLREVASRTGTGEATSRLTVTCKSPRKFREGKDGERLPDPFTLELCLKASLVDRKYPFIEIFLEPRLLLESRMPTRIVLRTPMPHTFKAMEGNQKSEAEGKKEGYEIYHELSQGELVEVFTPGPSIAVSVKCADSPVGGTATDWMEGGWVDVPLVREFGLSEPIRCVLPFIRRNRGDYTLVNGRSFDGSEFFIVEASDNLDESLQDYSERTQTDGDHSSAYEDDDSPVELVEPKATTRKIMITVCNYAVDHTGDVLFETVGEQVEGNMINSASAVERSIRRRSTAVSCPFGAYASRNRRISLLPHQKEPLRLLHLTMEGDEGVRRSQPFLLDDISIGSGGLESTAVNWEDGSESGFYAYRKLVDSYQFEVHIVPEFVVFNGSKEYCVLVKQQGGVSKMIEPGKVAPVKRTPQLGLVLSIDFIDLQASTAAMTVDLVGLRVAVVRARNGSPIGSLAVQTIIGNQDSKLAVKLGELKVGARVESKHLEKPSQGMFDDDTIRFRIRWSEFQVTLNEARTIDSDHPSSTPSMQSALDNFIESQSPATAKSSPRQRSFADANSRHQSQEQLEIERQTQQPVCTIVLLRFTVDYQRIFKSKVGDTENDFPSMSTRDLLLSPERSQFSVIVHNVQLLDETPKSKFPVVFDSSSLTTSFFDLCLRFRGPLKTELVKVDLFDLNLAHAHGKSEKIIIQTSEDFVWKAIDVANRIAVSTAELAGYDLNLTWDEQDGGYVVSMKNTATEVGYFDTEGSYSPPSSERLYDVNTARVSPFEVQVSFIRRPQASRYRHLQNLRGAKLMNYFTQKLKFKVDRADLKFARYEASGIKGPPDQLIQILLAVYTQRMKYKVVTMLSAVSFEDWKNFAARDTGGDEFMEGDLLRVTGNLAGGTAGYFAKRVGSGIGKGIGIVTSTLGDEIEEATDKVGARCVGAGVNSVVTGLGEGVGDTFKGVGSGTGKVLQGAGKGVGQIFGGVTGGATMVAKGIGKGIMEGDGKAVVTGLSRGAQSVGTGLGQGVESAVMGAADGVVTCGEGVVSGAKSIGKGFASAFSGGKRRSHPPRRDSG